jgi:hypothetical protein
MSDPITPSQIKVRQVTNYQYSWTESEPGESGTFTIQLVLDNGVEEYILRPSVDDMDVLSGLLAKGSDVHFDIDRKVLMFGNESV